MNSTLYSYPKAQAEGIECSISFFFGKSCSIALKMFYPNALLKMKWGIACSRHWPTSVVALLRLRVDWLRNVPFLCRGYLFC